MKARLYFASILLVFGGCGPGTTLENENAQTCITHIDCNDELFCNGEELCEAGYCQDSEPPCPGEFEDCAELCDEEMDTCNSFCLEDEDCFEGVCQDCSCVEMG